MLQGFTAFNFSEGVPYVSVTSNGVTFNKSTVMKLNYPEHVLLLIDEEGKRIAVQVCDAETPNAASFFKPGKSKAVSVRWNGRDLINTLADMMGWDLRFCGYRAEGALLKEDRAVLFDLCNATAME